MTNLVMEGLEIKKTEKLCNPRDTERGPGLSTWPSSSNTVTLGNTHILSLILFTGKLTWPFCAVKGRGGEVSSRQIEGLSQRSDSG